MVGGRELETERAHLILTCDADGAPKRGDLLSLQVIVVTAN